MAVYNGQRGFLGEVRRSGLGDVASSREAALLQGVILRSLPHQGHCGSDVLAAAHTGLVKAGGDGVVCASVQGHVVEGYAGNVRVCRAIIRLGRNRYPGDRQRLLPNADRHAGGCGIVVVCIANHPIPHGICSGIGAGRDVLTVCAVLGQAVLHGAIVRHARSNQRLLLSGIGQIFLRRGSGEGGGSLVHLDGHSSGRSRVFLVARSRSERPFGFIVVTCSWLDCAIFPCECTLDLIAGCGVFHLARNGALAQLVAVGDVACGNVAIHHRRDFVHCVEIERQIETLIVVRGDINRDGSDFAGFPAAQCSNRQRQNAIVNRNVINVIPIFKVERESAIIGYVAIGSLGRVGQKLLGIIGVFQLRAVDHVQCAIPDVRGRVGLGDGESRAAGLCDYLRC